MRTFLMSGLILTLLLLGTPAVQADEGAERHSASKTAEKALEVLKVRMEARIKEGELLAKFGRLEEALEAYRSVGTLYDAGMVRIQRLIADMVIADSGVVPKPRAPDLKEPSAGAGPFAGRSPARRKRPSGAKASQAIGYALDWLKSHQSLSGKWGASEFPNWCNGKRVALSAASPDGRGKAVHDVGVTGLALLAYLGAGYTDRGNHPYAKTISLGLRYLKTVQDAEGCIGPRTSQQYVYGHGIGALAIIEAYGMTASPILKGSAQKALDFIAATRNPYMGWRYGVKPGDNDTSVTTWMIMCLKSAVLINRDYTKRGKPAPLTVDEHAFDGARAWLDKVTDPDNGRVGYLQRGTGPARAQEMMDRFPAEKSEAMTAAGIFTRTLMGEDPRRSAIIRKGADLCIKLPPTWNAADGSIDMYYWYYGTLAMFQVGGKHWQVWRKALDTAVLERQRMDTDSCQYKGSWDPIGPWGLDGGRVYSTAMLTLCLEASFRYDRVFGTK